MKSDMNRRYHTRVITNIIYSAIISCLVEIFLVTNVSMITFSFLKNQSARTRSCWR